MIELGCDDSLAWSFTGDANVAEIGAVEPGHHGAERIAGAGVRKKVITRSGPSLS